MSDGGVKRIPFIYPFSSSTPGLPLSSARPLLPMPPVPTPPAEPAVTSLTLQARAPANTDCSPTSLLLPPDSPIAATTKKPPSPPPPQAFVDAEDAIPPDRKGTHLDPKSEEVENTNGARGDHGCGHSGAQATAHKAVLKATMSDDGVKRIPFIYPFSSSTPGLPLSSARPLLPMPPVPTPPAEPAVTSPNSQQNA
jgi:hypothetical protein